ncbi:MAG: pyridoxal phosphate enzyme (YggS family) [Candidatus Krumholzibacteriia bacterium]|jgi:pyridoxal phosphate enzyme (YggS family)
MADLQVADRLAQVRENIATACAQTGRPEGSVQLVAVSKLIPLEKIMEACHAGQMVFGENRIPTAIDRQAELIPLLNAANISPARIQWHFIGHLQRNKANKATGQFKLIHGVDSLALAAKISQQAVAQGQSQSLLLEVNISGEAQKNGLLPESALDIAKEVSEMPHLELCGLMGMAARGVADVTLGKTFGKLRRLCEDIRQETGLPLPELSMGMSGDYEVAIAEGATTVRVGSAIFGPRS